MSLKDTFSSCTFAVLTIFLILISYNHHNHVFTLLTLWHLLGKGLKSTEHQCLSVSVFLKSALKKKKKKCMCLNLKSLSQTLIWPGNPTIGVFKKLLKDEYYEKTMLRFQNVFCTKINLVNFHFSSNFWSTLINPYVIFLTPQNLLTCPNQLNLFLRKRTNYIRSYASSHQCNNWSTTCIYSYLQVKCPLSYWKVK